jgi:hypothetical protein
MDQRNGEDARTVIKIRRQADAPVGIKNKYKILLSTIHSDIINWRSAESDRHQLSNAQGIFNPDLPIRLHSRR